MTRKWLMSTALFSMLSSFPSRFRGFSIFDDAVQRILSKHLSLRLLMSLLCRKKALLHFFESIPSYFYIKVKAKFLYISLPKMLFSYPETTAYNFYTQTSNSIRFSFHQCQKCIDNSITKKLFQNQNAKTLKIILQKNHIEISFFISCKMCTRCMHGVSTV